MLPKATTLVSLTDRASANGEPITLAQATAALYVITHTHREDAPAGSLNLLDRYFAQEQSLVHRFSNPLYQIKKSLEANYEMGVGVSPDVLIFSEHQTLPQYIDGQMALAAESHEANNKHYRAFLMDFFWRLTLPDSDEGRIGADELFNEIIAEVGVHNYATKARGLSERMHKFTRLTQHVENAAQMVKLTNDLIGKYMSLTDTREMLGELLDIYDGPKFRATAIAVGAPKPSHMIPAPVPTLYGSIHWSGRDRHGILKESGTRTSFDPNRDLHMMAAFLEYDSAIERGVAINCKLGNTYLSSTSPVDENNCQACDGDFCTATKGCVAVSNPVPEAGPTDTSGRGYFYVREIGEEGWRSATRSEFDAAHLDPRTDYMMTTTNLCLDEGCPHHGTMHSCSTAADKQAEADDNAVDRFAAAMKAKMAKSRLKGRSGWDDATQCSTLALSELLWEHVGKGDPVDVANFAMMLNSRGAAIAPRHAVGTAPTMAASDWESRYWKDVERLTHERNALGQAIADAALAARIYNGEVQLNGPQLIAMCGDLGREAKNGASEAAIAYALEDEEGMQFLRYWNEGEFDILRRNWDNIPDEVFIGADSKFAPANATMASVGVPPSTGTTHILKTDHEPFDAVARGVKTHEIRNNDRNFEVGDFIELVRYPEVPGEEYPHITRTISHIQSGYGMMGAWVVLSFAGMYMGGQVAVK